MMPKVYACTKLSLSCTPGRPLRTVEMDGEYEDEQARPGRWNAVYPLLRFGGDFSWVYMTEYPHIRIPDITLAFALPTKV